MISSLAGSNRTFSNFFDKVLLKIIFFSLIFSITQNCLKLFIIRATHAATLRSHITTLRDSRSDFVRPMFRISATQAFCGSMKFRSQKSQFGNPIRSQLESRTSARVKKKWLFNYSKMLLTNIRG